MNKVQKVQQFQLGGPEKNASELMTRDTLHKKTEAWQINGTSTMVTSSVIRSWCRPYLQEFDAAKDRIKAER